MTLLEAAPNPDALPPTQYRLYQLLFSSLYPVSYDSLKKMGLSQNQIRNGLYKLRKSGYNIQTLRVLTLKD